MRACSMSRYDIVKKLLECGADVNFGNSANKTSAMLACLTGNLEVMCNHLVTQSKFSFNIVKGFCLLSNNRGLHIGYTAGTDRIKKYWSLIG